MLDLSDKLKFKSDIDGTHVTMYPFIFIYPQGEYESLPFTHPDLIGISTVQESIIMQVLGNSYTLPFHLKDYNLKISNIKESLNLENHSFQISNVTITFNNYEQNGERLSDTLSDSINKNVAVYYKTQSCSNILDCLQVYEGKIRRINHDDSTVKLTLEDLTDSTFHKDVPIANMGTRKNCYSKDYINKYIPITYGKVAKAPVIPYVTDVGELGNYYISIIADDVEDVTNSGRNLNITGFLSSENNGEMFAFPTDNNSTENPLYIYKGDYFRVLQNYESDFHNVPEEEGRALYPKFSQYSIDQSQNFLSIEKIFSSGFAQNPPANNELQTVKLSYPNQAELLRTESSSGDVGDNSSVINIETSIFRPDASVDNPDKPSAFYDEEQNNFLDTYSEVPYNEIHIDQYISELQIYVNGFRPSYSGTNREGIHYPTMSTNTGDTRYCRTNYLWTISAWLQSNAHRFNGSVKFVNMPSGNLVYQRARYVVSNPINGWATDEDGAWANDTQTSADHYFDVDPTEYGIRIKPQYGINYRFLAKWKEASGLTNAPDFLDIKPTISDNGNYFFSSDDSNTFRDWVHSDLLPIYDEEMSHWHAHGQDEFGNLIAIPVHEGYNRFDPWSKVLQPDGTYDTDYDHVLDPSQQWFHIYSSENCGTNVANTPPLTGSTFIPHGEANPYRSISMRNINKKILSGQLASELGNTKPCYYPTAMYYIGMDENHPNNQLFKINKVIVGNWITDSMGAYGDCYDYSDTFDYGLVTFSSGLSHLTVNMFDDGSGIPYLFKLDDFAVFTPREQIHHNWGDTNTKYTVLSKYFCEWNGVPIGIWRRSNTDKIITDYGGASFVLNNPYAGGYGWTSITDGNQHITMAEIAGGNDEGSGENECWWMYVTEDISAQQVMAQMGESGLDVFTENPSSNRNGIIIKKGTLIPCNSRADTNDSSSWEYSGIGFAKGSESMYGDDKDSITLKAGTEATAEERIGVLFPFNEISSNDEIAGETSTYVFGKLDLNIAQDDQNDNIIVNSLTVNDNLLVQAYASRQIESIDTLNYNAEFVGETVDAVSSAYSTSLLKIPGNDSVFQSGGTLSWQTEIISQDAGGSNTLPNEYTSIHDYKISDWSSLNEYDALSLVYRAVNENRNEQNQVAVSTDIFNIGILQFPIFENALNDNLYADVYGRANTPEDVFVDSNGDEFAKYTNNVISEEGDFQLIEKPTDVIYNFIEKELNQVDIVNRDSFIKARESRGDINLGFSIKDKINSRKLIQDICKNSMLFPKFDNKGTFSFKYLNDMYTSSDMIIKQKDVIKFSFTRTPIENVITMVNVKYRKDYENDNYTRATGYCDAYDFYGNGENGQVVYKANGQEVGGYDYSSLGLSRESNILEFESDYIRDYNSAKILRNYLLMQNCNQHTIIKSTLPLKYIQLEVGDIIEFDKLNNNTKAYGENYTKTNDRNGQMIYQHFMITSAIKSSKGIQIECIQLHELAPTFEPGKGSLTRRSEVGVDALVQTLTLINTYLEGVDLSGEDFSNYQNHFTEEDYEFYEEMEEGYIPYLTSKQKRIADLTSDGLIDKDDIFIASEILRYIQEDIGN